ncbi:MAG: DUF1080 domain-containing protein [Planctomycetes bacterium]|nr:DUF1080 domain-containing protein [Planctomycetota bacterium]
MAEQTVKCPRCGQMVAVPTTGEKVHCPGCGQKFRFDTPKTVTITPLPIAPPPAEAKAAPSPSLETQDVQCPDCGAVVRVPVSGERVFCACGRKFRLDVAERPPELPLPSDPDAPLPVLPSLLLGQDVRCPDCGKVLHVSAMADKVRCPCGRKFWIDALTDRSGGGEHATEDALEVEVPGKEAPTPPPQAPPAPARKEVTCPDCGMPVQVPLSGEKVYCVCGRKFRCEAPAASPLSLSGRGEGEGRAAVPPSPYPLPGREGGGAAEAPAEPPLPRGAAQQELRPPEPREAAKVEALGDEAPTPPPAPATKEVTCPDCGMPVQVPLSGEKVYCICGRKFRCEAPAASPLSLSGRGEGEGRAAVPPSPYPLPGREGGRAAEAPAEPPLPRGAAQQELRPPEPRGRAEEALEVQVLGDEAPTPPPAAANQVKCPRCGSMVRVPLSGEKVRCPGCGQKFRFEAPLSLPGRGEGEGGPAALPSPFPLPEREGGGATAGVPGIAAPSAVLAAAAAAAPPPTATPAAAEELRGLWTWLRGTIHGAYEGGRADDEARVAFRQKADRAALLATVFLGVPGPASSEGHVFVTSVLPEMALDEIHHLSLEDYRKLDESLDDVQHLLDARVPQAPAPPPPALPRPAAAAPPAPAKAPAAPRRRGLTTFEAAAAILSVAALAAAIVFFPEIKDFAARLQSRGDLKPKTSLSPGTETVLVPEPPKAATRTRVRTPRNKTPDVSTDVPVVKIPDFEPPTPKVETSVPVPPDKEKEKGEPEPPLPKDKPEPAEPESPWAKLGLGVHRLFNGTDLKDWTQSGAWAVRGGEAHARAPAGPVAMAVAGNPEWADYTLQVRARIVRADRMTREGEYFLVILRYQDPQNYMCVRFPIEGIYEVGYYRDGAFHEAGRARHGLGSRFNQWHTIEVGVSGNKISVVIDDNRTGAPPWIVRGLDRGPCGIGVTGGEAAFEQVRVKVER